MNKFKRCLEIQIFGVCHYLGEKFGISTARIRLFFIYITFIAAGSPLIIYFALAFLLDLKNYFKRKSTRIWDL
ncbi:MAG: PspC family transcriptional regulator [Bacteroidetes bacterium]|nr:MAG: PspC family transcriptional regulator [Bacteroidota bacterium]